MRVFVVVVLLALLGGCVPSPSSEAGVEGKSAQAPDPHHIVFDGFRAHSARFLKTLQELRQRYRTGVTVIPRGALAQGGDELPWWRRENAELAACEHSNPHSTLCFDLRQASVLESVGSELPPWGAPVDREAYELPDRALSPIMAFEQMRRQFVSWLLPERLAKEEAATWVPFSGKPLDVNLVRHPSDLAKLQGLIFRGPDRFDDAIWSRRVLWVFPVNDVFERAAQQPGEGVYSHNERLIYAVSSASPVAFVDFGLPQPERRESPSKVWDEAFLHARLASLVDDKSKVSFYSAYECHAHAQAYDVRLQLSVAQEVDSDAYAFRQLAFSEAFDSQRESPRAKARFSVLWVCDIKGGSAPRLSLPPPRVLLPA